MRNRRYQLLHDVELHIGNALSHHPERIRTTTGKTFENARRIQNRGMKPAWI